MSRNRRHKTGQFAQQAGGAGRRVALTMKASLRPVSLSALSVAWLLPALLCAMLVALVEPARAQSMNWGNAPAPTQAAASPEMAGFQHELEALLKSKTEEEAAVPAAAASGANGANGATGAQASLPFKPRLEVILGRLDPRLKLAPCEKVRAFLPEGTRLWGRSRVGLRCEQGPVRWNVYWPVTIKVWAPALVATGPLRAGATVSEADFRMAEVDLAETLSPAVTDVAEVAGRTLIRNVEPGESLRQDDIKLRRWFAAGEPVKVTVKGNGFAVGAEGTALSHGDEGRCARIRIDSGRVLCGLPVGERRAEVTL